MNRHKEFIGLHIKMLRDLPSFTSKDRSLKRTLLKGKILLLKDRATDSNWDNGNFLLGEAVSDKTLWYVQTHEFCFLSALEELARAFDEPPA